MDIQALTQYFLQYGAVFIFVIVLLEYLNLPGFPAGVIMPLAGIWAAKGQIGLGMALLERRGAVGIFVSKLIPMVRTVISIPAGVIRMNFIKYSVSSALGIFVWNFFLIGAG